MSERDVQKQCRSCGQVLNASAFYAKERGKLGLTGSCKKCILQQQMDAYVKKFGRKRQPKTFFSSDSERAARKAERNRFYNERFPIKRKARDAVHNAIRDGKLSKQPCEVCGANAQAHHDDYAKPLEVRWLCQVHHQAWHRENGPGLNADVEVCNAA